MKLVEFDSWIHERIDEVGRSNPACMMIVATQLRIYAEIAEEFDLPRQGVTSRFDAGPEQRIADRTVAAIGCGDDVDLSRSIRFYMGRIETVIKNSHPST